MLHISHKFYMTTSGFIFAAVGLAHGLRAFYEWDLVYNSWFVPVWVSWLVTLVAFLLAITAVRNMR